MPERMTPELVAGQHERFLLYGKSGAGKTFLAGTAPEPIWALGVGGLNEFKTWYSRPFLERYGHREIYVDAVREERGERGEMLDNPNGYDLICDTTDEFLEWNDREGIGVQTIVIDNATFLEYYIMNKAIAAEFAMSGGGDKAVLTREREYGIRKPHDSTYGGAQSLMDKYVRWLFELPFHIVFVAHTYETFTQKDKGRGQKLIGIDPLFVGKQRTHMPNLFDSVWYMSKSGGGNNPLFNVQTQGDEKITGKTRVSGILRFSERNVDLSEVIEKFSEYPKTISQE